MKIIIIGGGWYGCHLAMALKGEHDIALLEQRPELFRGASGSNPARLHIGPHYPRSQRTRRACQSHSEAFLAHYGELTRPIGRNLYAVAENDSLMDFGTYQQVLRSEIECIRVYDAAEFGLKHVEGALLVNERHIVTDAARRFFTKELESVVTYDAEVEFVDSARGWADLVIDATFCTNDEVGIDRFEPCITLMLEGPTFEAVTIMDGPFPSLYPWNEDSGLSSLTSAKFTPLARCSTHAKAREVLAEQTAETISARAAAMIAQMAHFLPRMLDSHKHVGELLSVRAMPRSGSAERLVDVQQVDDKTLRIRAGKIDAVFEAEIQVREAIARLQGSPRTLDVTSMGGLRRAVAGGCG